MDQADPFGFTGLTYDDVLLLPGHTDVIPSEANFVWATRPAGVQTIFQELRRHNILVRYMDYGPLGAGLRISVGTDAEIDRLLETLRGIV